MGTKVIKTAGQVAYEDYRAAADIPFTWEQTAKAAWESLAKKHNIQPIVEHVPEPPTDGELLVKAYDTKYDEGKNAIAAEFLRLRAERDGTGEPLPVTAEWLNEAIKNANSYSFREVADRINQHRGVRPVPQVTAEMMEGARKAYRECFGDEKASYAAAADYLNAELAKGAAVQTVTPMKVAAYVLSNGILHTFEDDTDMVAFTKSHAWGSAARVDGHEHHPRKDGGA